MSSVVAIPPAHIPASPLCLKTTTSQVAAAAAIKNGTPTKKFATTACSNKDIISSTPTSGHSTRSSNHTPKPHVITNGSSVIAAAETDSGKSSCSPAALDCSFDSGIVVEVNDLRLHKRIQQCKRILITLERDKDAYHMLRERLRKISDRQNRKPNEEEHFCNVCCTEIHLENTRSVVKCAICQKYICRGDKCSDWVPKAAQWECQLCHTSKQSLAQTSSWVAEQMSFNEQKLVYPMRARSEIYIPISDINDSSMPFESVSQIGVNSATINAEQKRKIREYVEELVSSMLGGSLDSTKVTQMSKSENYLQLFYNYHSKLSNCFINLENTLCTRIFNGDLPAIVNGQQHPLQHQQQDGTISHNSRINNNNNNSSGNDLYDFANVSERRLRQLIESIIAETLKMPPFASVTGAVSEIALDTRSTASALPNGHRRRHRTEHYFEPKIYQDLLATAVLNKIVDKQGNSTRVISESTPDLRGHHALDNNLNVENQSTTSDSSLEPKSECSFSDAEKNYKLNKGASLSPSGSQENIHADNEAIAFLNSGRESALSDYVAQHMVPLPDLSAPLTESEEDDYISVTSSTIGEGTWEDNWLFKKKRQSLKNAPTTGSLGMLVPAPKEDVRAQIGDKVADEVSDLSEMGSDIDDSSLDLLRSNAEPFNDRLLNKHLIGGQNTKIALDELIESASMVSNTSLKENEPIYTETKNLHIDANGPKIEAINSDVNHLKTPEVTTGIISPPMNFKDAKIEESTEIVTPSPLSGSIAEREYKKWYNAVDMPNNPYAPEALKRRISGSQERFIDLPNISPTTEQNPIALLKNAPDEANGNADKHQNDCKRYSRDYYINDDAKDSTASSNAASPQRQCSSANITDEPAIDNITINEKAAKANASVSEQPQSSINKFTSGEVYQALPVHVVEETASIDTLSNPSLQSVNTTTSDDSDTVRIYDFNKQETTTIREPKPKTAVDSSKALSTTATTTVENSVTKPTPKTFTQKRRPQDLQLGNSSNTSVPTAATGASSTPTLTPTRGSTPTAFKFLQPKRKLIEPSQVLSLDESEVITSPPPDRAVIEDEVAQVLPSVKALAQAFLLTTSKTKSSSLENRWRTKIKGKMDSQKKTPAPLVNTKLDASPALADTAEDATITSDLSSLETDPPTNEEIETKDSNTIQTPSLKNNIAFFENLKFK